MPQMSSMLVVSLMAMFSFFNFLTICELYFSLSWRSVGISSFISFKQSSLMF